MRARVESRGDERGVVKVLLLVVIGVVIAGGVGVWWYFIRDSAPSKAKLTERTTVQPTSGPDGTWKAAKGDTTFAGFRIDEQFSALSHTAVVRTPTVSGSFSLSGTAVSATTITADLTGLESKDDAPPGPPLANRVRFLQNGGLEIGKFPSATFVQTGAVSLPSVPKAGAKFQVNASGKLTIHGVTKDVTIPIEASWNGAVVDISGSLPVTLADYGITPPSLGFVTVADKGTLEFQINYTK